MINVCEQQIETNENNHSSTASAGRLCTGIAEVRIQVSVHTFLATNKVARETASIIHIPCYVYLKYIRQRGLMYLTFTASLREGPRF